MIAQFVEIETGKGADALDRAAEALPRRWPRPGRRRLRLWRREPDQSGRAASQRASRRTGKPLTPPLRTCCRSSAKSRRRLPPHPGIAKVFFTCCTGRSAASQAAQLRLWSKGCLLRFRTDFLNWPISVLMESVSARPVPTTDTHQGKHLGDFQRVSARLVLTTRDNCSD